MSSSGHIQTPTHKNWEHAQIPPVGMCGRIVCGFQIFTSHQLYPGNPCMQNYRSKLKKHKLSPFPLKIAVSKKNVRSCFFRSCDVQSCLFQIIQCSLMFSMVIWCSTNVGSYCLNISLIIPCSINVCSADLRSFDVQSIWWCM